ncbi:hypothetical protein BCR33DRAFT_768083 [Rhizoclosmatium globosum]|uniref:Bulb-type lectin domain-containing protein n=1 Tax=Rhizoclosmatium globosum TaxID=329046 RepID=A0A1Y2C0T4_9FUNG|nr:hypothetical protein BCR33DRAFT_768083 [Rhizoclosmatium globosum]|eukprot:ORY40514.1 hypothetical protein BCR33DRAFT_768083 [Rhizoclosmatium globosum]
MQVLIIAAVLANAAHFVSAACTLNKLTPDAVLGNAVCIKKGTVFNKCDYLGGDNKQAFIVMQDDSNFVASAGDYSFQTVTYNSVATFFKYQTDGSLQVVGPSSTYWTASTWGSNGLLCIDQSSAVVTLYNSGSASLYNKIWDSTNGASNHDNPSGTYFGAYLPGVTTSNPGPGPIEINIGACGGATAVGTSSLKQPSFAKSGDTSSLAFSIASADLFNTQKMFISCGTPSTVASSGSTCSFTIDFKDCGTSATLYNSILVSNKIVASASTPIDLTILGSATATLTAQEDETATLNIQAVYSVDSNVNTKIQADVNLFLDNTIPGLQYYVSPISLASSDRVDTVSAKSDASPFTATFHGLQCGTPSSYNFNVFSCLPSVTGAAAASGNAGCSNQKQVTLTFTPNGVTGTTCFTAEITKTFTLTVYKNDGTTTNDTPFVGDIIRLRLGDVTTPKLYVTEVKVQVGNGAIITLPTTCFGDANGNTNTNKYDLTTPAANGDWLQLQLGDSLGGAFTAPASCSVLADLKVFTVGTYTITVTYTSLQNYRRRDVIYSSSATVINVKSSGLSVAAIVGASVGSVAGVALIVAGGLAYRRRRQNKSTAAAAAKEDLEQVKEDALLVAQ